MKTIQRCSSCSAVFWSDALARFCIDCHSTKKRKLFGAPQCTYGNSTQNSIPSIDDAGVDSKLGVESSLHDDKEGEETSECVVCGQNLDELCGEDVEAKEAHLETCSTQMALQSVYESCVAGGISLSQEEMEEKAMSQASQGLTSTYFSCLICSMDLSSKKLVQRCSHLKKCAKINQVHIRTVLQLIYPREENMTENKNNNRKEEDREEVIHAIENVLDNTNTLDIVDIYCGNEEERVEESLQDSALIIDLCNSSDDEDPDQENGNREKENVSRRRTTSCKRGANSLNSGRSTTDNVYPIFRPKSPEVINIHSTQSQSPPHGSAVMESSESKKDEVNKPNRNAFSLLMKNARTKAVEQELVDNAINSKDRKKGNRSRRTGSTGTWNKKRENAPRGWAPAYKKISVDGMSCPIVVDGFQFACPELSNVYFLTHFHADHYIGLTQEFDAGFIYCTQTTASLVSLRLRIDKSRLKVLDLEKEYLLEFGGRPVKVFVTDANHCPGAALFLFLFENGRQVLHTGDFRWHSRLVTKSKVLRKLASCALPRNGASSSSVSSGTPSVVINKSLSVYLDTTYCAKAHVFPPQELTIGAVADCVKKEYRTAQQKGKKVFFLFGSYQIGKEKIFMSAAKAIGQKVYVESNKMKTMKCYSDWEPADLSLLTTNKEETCIHVCSMGSLNFEALEDVQKERESVLNVDKVYVMAFQPTGWSFTRQTKGAKRATGSVKLDTFFTESKVNKLQNEENVFQRTWNGEPLLKERKNGTRDISIVSTAYSEHSSFDELIDFVRVMKPAFVVPTVNTNNVKEQISLIKEESGVYKRSAKK